MLSYYDFDYMFNHFFSSSDRQQISFPLSLLHISQNVIFDLYFHFNSAILCHSGLK